MAMDATRFGGNKAAKPTRPPSNIGYERMGGRQARPPSNIGYDRMGGGRPAIGNTAGRTPWGNEADIHRYKTGHLPGWGITDLARNIPHKSLSEATRGYESLESTPRGHYLPDRFGRMRPIDTGIGRLQEQAAIDPSDWRILQQIIKAGGNPDDYLETADMGGTYADPYEGLDIIDMEILPGLGYGGDNEYDFDYERNRFDDLISWPSYGARGGLMSLRR